MSEQENLTSVSQQENGEQIVDNTPYIEAIKEMKINYVPRSELEKIEKERDQLLDSIINGTELDMLMKSKNEPVDIKELRLKLFTTECDLSNLDYVSNALKLRDELLKGVRKIHFYLQGKKSFQLKKTLQLQIELLIS